MMKRKRFTKVTLKAALFAAFAAVSAFLSLTAAADSVAKIGETGYETLAAALAAVAEGKPLTSVDETAWPSGTPVYYNGKFYAKSASKGALELAIDAANEANSDAVAKIYVRPGFTANELVLQAHQNLKTSLAIYGNDASLSGGWEPCIDGPYHTLTKDVSIAIYNLHKGAGVWGVRVTSHAVDILLADCKDVLEIMINGSTGEGSVNNYTIRRCSFDGKGTAHQGVCVASTSAGKIVIEDCSFADLNQNYVVNPNNCNGGKMEVVIRDTSFTNCGTASKAAIRVAGEKAGTSATVTLENLTFDEYSATNAIGIGKKELNENNAEITYSITGTTGTLNVFEKGGSDETITPAATTLAPTTAYAGANFVVAKIGTEEYKTVDAAMEAAAAKGAATTVTLLADSEDATVVPTWFLANDVTIDAASATTATFAPVTNASDAPDTDGMAYLASADISSVRTFTVGENVTLAFPETSTKKGALYFGYGKVDGKGGWVPINVVLNGRIEAYEPYLGSGSTISISKTGSLKSSSECLITRSASTMTVTGTNGAWGAENPQVVLSYVAQQGGEVFLKDTFVNAGAWWSMQNRSGVTEPATKLVLDNTAFVADAFKGASKSSGETSAYEVELRNGSQMTIAGNFGVIAEGVVTIEPGSLIAAKSISNAGTINIDATDSDPVKVIDYTGANALTLADYGTVNVTGGKAYVKDNDLWVTGTVVAKINETEYYFLADAIAAAKEGDTITLMTDITETDAKGDAIPYIMTGVTLDLNGHTYTQYNYAHVFQGTGGVIKNGKMVCAPYGSDEGAANGSYALFIGYHVGDGGKHEKDATAETTSFTVQNVEMTGGINISHATGVVLDNLIVNGTKYYAVWTEEGSSVTIKGGTYTTGALALLNGAANTSIAVEDGTFYAKDKSLVYNSGVIPSISGGTFDTAVDAKYCAAGYVPVQDEDGTYGVKIPVAKIGTTQYYTLAEAINAAKKGDTITLVADVAEDIEISKDITFDLGSKTLSNANAGKATLTVAHGVTATVKNGSIVGGTSYYAIENLGTATFEGVAAKAGNVGSSMIDNQGTLTIDSGTYEGGMNTVKNEPNATLTVNGGTFENAYGESGAHTGVIYNLGSVEIVDGTFTQLATSPAWAYPHVIMTASDGATPSTVVKGGTFTSTLKNWKGTILNHDGAGSVGCTAVSGGIFNMKVSESYCATGYRPVETSSGVYGVADAIQVLAADGSVVGSYHSLAAAFEAATAGQTVQLLGDVKETDAADSDIVYDMTGVTFDLNGYTYSQNNFAHVFEGTGGVIKNGKMVCLNRGSYALFIGENAGKTTSFTVEDVEMTGGINACCASGIVLKGLTVHAQNYYAVWSDEIAEVTIESGTYEATSSEKGKALFNASHKNGKLTITGGTFRALDNALMGSAGGTLTVSGGTFDTAVDEAYCADGFGPTQIADGVYGVFKTADVTFDTLCGSVVTQKQTRVYDNLPSAEPTRENYVFAGWFLDVADETTQAEVGAEWLVEGNHTLYAKWTVDPSVLPNAESAVKCEDNGDGTVTVVGFGDITLSGGALVIPDMIGGKFVTAIADKAFANAANITSVTLPLFLEKIGSRAFYNIKTLETLNIPKVRNWRNPSAAGSLVFGTYAFSTAALKELWLPEEVTEIGNYAFMNCQRLERVTILGAPTVGTRPFRRSGIATGSRPTVHLNPDLAKDAAYLADLTSDFGATGLSPLVRTDAIVESVSVGGLALGAETVHLSAAVGRAADWGAVDASRVKVEYRENLGDTPTLLEPSAVSVGADGTLSVEVAKPEGNSGFFRVKITN